MCIPKTFYLVDTQRGNTFTMTENSIPHTITVPTGNYSSHSFMSVVGALMTAASGYAITYTMTMPTRLQTQTLFITITATDNSSNHPLSITVGTALAQQFGLAVGESAFTTNVLTSQKPVLFQRQSTIYLYSPDLVLPQTQQLVLSGVLQEINTATVADGDYIVYTNPNPLYDCQPLRKKGDGLYEFYIKDGDGADIDLNSHDFTFSLIFFQRSYHDEMMINSKRLEIVERELKN
jgi:hypothetical protein